MHSLKNNIVVTDASFSFIFFLALMYDQKIDFILNRKMHMDEYYIDFFLLHFIIASGHLHMCVQRSRFTETNLAAL